MNVALETCRTSLRDLIAEHRLEDERLLVSARSLTPIEAIGEPTRRDYPIVEGNSE